MISVFFRTACFQPNLRYNQGVSGTLRINLDLRNAFWISLCDTFQISNAHWMLQWIENIFICIGTATDIRVVLPCCLQQVAAGVKFLKLYLQISFQREQVGSPKES